MTGVINDTALKGSPSPMEDNVTQSESETAVSKRSMKRIAKREKWEKTKMEKRFQKKARFLFQIYFMLKINSFLFSSKDLKQTTMGSSSCKQRVCVDLSLDSYMSEKDCNKCMKQVMRCYSLNRRAANPLQFYVTSLIGRPKEVLDKNKGCEFWDEVGDPLWLELGGSRHVILVFKYEIVVVTTCCSHNCIANIEVTVAHLIALKVDHKLLKGLTHRLAIEAGIAHAKLPLDEFIDMKTRKVLTIDQERIVYERKRCWCWYPVYDILRRMANGEHWGEAIVAALPSRKGAFVKDEES
nr:EOG090X0D3U [Artemia franciscana]